MFVAIEGIDGAGKTTLVQSLKEALVARGRCVETAHLPIGDIQTERFTANELAMLFSIDRSSFVRHALMEWLSMPAHVVVDRYVASMAAYQLAQGADPDLVKALVKVTPMPDLTIYMDVSVEEGCRRVVERGETPHMLFLEKVLGNYRSPDFWLDYLGNAGRIVPLDTEALSREELVLAVLTEMGVPA